MKRDGHIIEEIVQWGNLNEAFDTVLRGTERKRLGEGKWLMRHREEFIRQMEREITSGHIDLGKWHPKDIMEAGKQRHLQVFNMRVRMKVGAMMIVVDRHLRPRYIRTTAASIRGRGMHDLKARMERDLRTHPDLKYWYKFDVRKCYETTDQEAVMQSVRRTFKDERLISILRQCVCVLDNGLSMGMRSSQGMENLLLSQHLDHPVKDQRRTKEHYRYCDDGAIGGKDKQELWKQRDFVHNQIEGIGQTIKPNDRIFPVEEGIDMLGYVIYPDHTMLRKRVKKTVARKLKKVKSRRRRKELVASFYGMAKHADCRHLMKKLLTPTEMKKFSELGISYKPADGKKHFTGSVKHLSDIVNKQIEVHDFERDVSTKHGASRYLVSFRDVATGEFGKFFTNSEDMKLQLDTAAQIEGAIPFSTVIATEHFVIDGENKLKYKFT